MVGYNEPLGLPKGSVRAILALGTVFSAVALLAVGKVSVENFLAISGIVLGFYFGLKKESE